MKKHRWKIIVTAFITLFVLANIIVFNHAYHFTHFEETGIAKTKQPEDLSFTEKLNALFFGVRVLKPQNKTQPAHPYKTFYLESDGQLEGWEIPAENSQGVVILFHGYISTKSQMLTYADAFHTKGYATVLIDFRAHGGSQGLETTIGFKEGKDVKATFDYVKKIYPNQDIILFGCSMGAVAIMKSIAQYDITPDKIILECPFGSMLETAKHRFEVMNAPATPLAEWLILFGGMQTGFNAFDHKPEKYATKINVPTALFVGAKDPRVCRTEIDRIYKNLAGQKVLGIFKNSSHQSYLTNDAEDWHELVDTFLSK